VTRGYQLSYAAVVAAGFGMAGTGWLREMLAAERQLASRLIAGSRDGGMLMFVTTCGTIIRRGSERGGGHYGSGGTFNQHGTIPSGRMPPRRLCLTV